MKSFGRGLIVIAVALFVVSALTWAQVNSGTIRIEPKPQQGPIWMNLAGETGQPKLPPIKNPVQPRPMASGRGGGGTSGANVGAIVGPRDGSMGAIGRVRATEQHLKGLIRRLG